MTDGFELLHAGKVMFTVSCLSSLKKHGARFRWPTVTGGMLCVWLAACAMTASAAAVETGSGASVSVAEQSHDLLRAPQKSWLSQTDAFKRARAATTDVDKLSIAPGSHFRAITRIYDASAEHQASEHAEQSASAMDEPMPQDEVAKFHQLETHVPIALARITSEFGHRSNPLGKGDVFHRGIDLAAPAGTPVYAVAPGTVVRANNDRAYGNVVVIDHHNGYKTLYAHNSRLLVKAGQQVKAGQPIAKVGSTGHSTGPHLHFEMHCSGHRVDPGPYLAGL
jgi:murein DD-endopeptidase MepM/ murein hydrolase activator NlpD